MKLPGSRILAATSASHPVRGAWIEISPNHTHVQSGKSHPVRGAWIEIMVSNMRLLFMMVAPREGCVD